MAEKMTWLQGELRHVPHKTTVKRILEDLAKTLVSQEWVGYDKNANDIAWTFNMRREIRLREPFKEDNLRLFKTTFEDGAYKKGVQLTLGEDYIVLNDVIRGKGDSSLEKSGIGDKVLIEVTYEADEFQRATFLEERLPSGEVEVVAKLKSRPQGQVVLYEDTILRIENEQLHQKGDNEVFTFARSPISDTLKATHRLKVMVDGVEKKVGIDFEMDYFNGNLTFNEPLESVTSITATYGYRTGLRGNLIPNDKYRVYGDRIIDRSGKTLKNLDVVVEVNYFWKLHYPEKIEDIRDSVDNRIVLSTDIDISSARDWSRTKTYYWEVKQYDKEDDEIDYLTGIKHRYGATLSEDDNTTLDDKLSSDWRKFSWYKGIVGKEEGVVLDDNLQVNFWVSFTREHLNITIQGNPTPDTGDNNNYIIGYGYVGMLEPYEGAIEEDYLNNFAYNFSSDIHPMKRTDYSTKWGQNTGTGITDILMEKTLSNVPYQAHLPAFHTTPEFMKKTFIGKSEATGEHHLSEITVVHHYERERGKLQNVLIGDRSALFHLDELISDKDVFDDRGVLLNNDDEFRNQCGKPVVSKEKHWLVFNINAPYWLGNNSPNVHYGIAIRTK